MKCGPLGETDRLLTLLSASDGLSRLAVPGARKPKSPLAAAVPLALLRLQVGGGSGLRRVRQLTVVRNYASLAGRLETLAAAQGLAELTIQLVPTGEGVPGLLEDLLMQLGRLELVVQDHQDSLEALAIAVQGCVHLLALGGYGLPLAHCARSGEPLEPPVGTWDWRCSLIPSEGLVIGGVLIPGAAAPKLITRAMLPKMKPGSVIVDVAIDQGGCVETARPTTHADPTYVVDNVVHYCVANMPGGVPRTSRFALNNATLPFGLALADKGWQQAWRDDTLLAEGDIRIGCVDALTFRPRRIPTQILDTLR